jgi:putative salt-induced outer membrane protein YdiY
MLSRVRPAGFAAWVWRLGALVRPLLLGLVLLGAAQTARAQAPDSTNVSPPDSTVIDKAGSFTPPPAGLPSAEFETYNVNGNGVRYTAALTGLVTTGTVERTYFSTSHTGNYTTGHWQFPAALSYSYGRQAGAVRERELLLLTTPDYRLGRWKFYALGEYETSNLRAIDRRVVAGGGVGYQLYADTLSNELTLSTFLLDERTDYNTEFDLQRHVVRNSTRLKARLNQKIVSFSELLFYQPSVTNPGGDYRLNSATVLAFKLYQHLALNLAYTFSYESVVVQSRARANGTLSVGFAYSTGK